MSFQRGTTAPRTRVQTSYGDDNIEPMSFKSAGVRTNAAEGYAMNPVGDIYAGVMDDMPKMDEIVDNALKNKAEEQINAWKAESQMAQAGIQAAANVASAEETAKGLEAQASAASKGGAMSAIAGVASAALPLMMSDEETKHTIDQLENACEVLRELRPVTFFYKEEYSLYPERMHYGFIAQEYQKVMPDATYRDENVGVLCIDTNELIGLLVRANQELETRITRLEAKQALAAV